LVKRILVADDDPQLREALAECLVLDGFELETACDGRQALDRARGAAPDVLLLDLDMPVADGRAVLDVWTSNPDLRHIPVVLMSAAPHIF
jgi:CheY-like chemotaxis protein